MPTITLKLARPHEAQRQIIKEAGRFNVVNCGRRFGKDVLLTDRIVRPALEGYPVAWVNPSYPMLTDVWKVFKSLLGPVAERIDSKEHRIELITGGVLDMWSLDAFESARGRKYKRMVINEAAISRHLQEAWENVLRPTLTDYKGDAWFGSTPKGRNYFWQLAERGRVGEHEEWRYFHRITADNPFIDPAEIEAARLELPELVFRQEYLAEFIEGSGVVFRRVRDCVGSFDSWPLPVPQDDKGKPTGSYTIGLDFAQKHDFTVATVIDRKTRTVVDLDRFNKIDWAYQRERIKNIYQKWGADLIVAEENSIGGPNIEALVADNINVWPFTTTAHSKAKIIQQLVMDIEQRTITLPDHKELIHELEAYEGELRLDGLMKYSAPEGQHDDCVMSLALGNWGCLE